jgi:cysteine-rich repeat protein
VTSTRPAAFAVIAIAACLRAPGYQCEDDTQCTRQADGVCVADACAYPDDACDGTALRWDEHGPSELAGSCVDGDATSGGSGDEGPPVSQCGNGEVDALEDCDDGNRDAGDACHPQCVVPGTVLWTVTYDAEAHSEDKGFGVAIDPASQSFYVAGFATVSMLDGQDTLLQKRWIEDGSLQWSRTQGGEARLDDTGENVAIDRDGNPILVGTLFGETTGGDVFVRGFDAGGGTRWTYMHDEQGDYDIANGVAVTSTNTIVVVGNIAIGDDRDVWMTRLDASGAVIGTPIVRGHLGTWDEALDADADADGWLVTGRLTDDSDQATVWTARYDRDGELLWEDLATAELVGNEARGVGMGLDRMGGSATGGVLGNDIFVRRYDAFGAIGTTITVAGPAEMHDEAADVAFAPDGSYVVAGFIDFATDGFATADSWIRKYAPDGTEEWTDTYDGPAHEIDKALAIAVTEDYSAIVVGYETVPGQARDVWMRRYAL